jgi:hypothetical protein
VALPGVLVSAVVVTVSSLSVGFAASR